MMRGAAAVAGLLLALGAGCTPAGKSGSTAGDPLAARRSLQDGRFDEVIARVGNGADAESLCLLGKAWMGKAQAAPLPTAPPGATVVAPGALFKTEELTALGFLERAVALRPDLAEAQLALADLLAPHAMARGAAGGTAPTGASPAGLPDASVERVLRAYGDAMQADPAGTTAAERLIAFALPAARLADADAAFQELLRRRREDPGLLVRYGDFLAGPRAMPEAALAQYAQALIWRPGDLGTRAKAADIHLQAAAAHLAQQQYASAEARLDQVRRLRIEDSSPEGVRARELSQALRDVRGR